MRGVKGEKKMKIELTIPNPEHVLERIEELQTCIDNFPNSPLLTCWKNALEELKKQPI